MNSVEPVLEVEGLSIRYGGGSPAVQDVSCSVGRGERVALVGESGSGKTTLGLAVAGFLTVPGVRIEARTLRVQGRDVPTVPASRLPVRTDGVAVVFQDAMTSLDSVWSIGSQLAAVLSNGRRRSRRQIADLSLEWLHRVGLTDTDRVLRARPYELSGGMRQRVMIALALCSEPRLLVADEPTSALDASLARASMELLLDLTSTAGTSLLIVSHDMDLCSEFSDRVLVMHRGRMVDQAPSDALDAPERHPYTRGLLECIPTLDTARLHHLPTLDEADVTRWTREPEGVS
jgi:ABC-type glutathione transport system ATPase component